MVSQEDIDCARGADFISGPRDQMNTPKAWKKLEKNKIGKIIADIQKGGIEKMLCGLILNLAQETI